MYTSNLCIYVKMLEYARYVHVYLYNIAYTSTMVQQQINSRYWYALHVLAEVDFSMDLDLLVLACEAQESPIEIMGKPMGKPVKMFPQKTYKLGELGKWWEVGKLGKTWDLLVTC